MYCSKTCNSRHYSQNTMKGIIIKKPKKEKIKKVIPPISSCKVCGEPFLVRRKDKSVCSRECYFKNKTLSEGKSIHHFREPGKLSKTIFIDIDIYLNEMKRKCWYADIADLYQLIDLHDRAFPNRYVAETEDKETLFIQMILELVLLHRQIKNRLNGKNISDE